MDEYDGEGSVRTHVSLPGDVVGAISQGLVTEPVRNRGNS